MKISKIVEKIKNNKKLQFILLGLLIAVILLVYVAYFIKGTANDKNSVQSENYQTSTDEYVAKLETKLENALSKIDNAGNVSVTITVSSGFVNKYAYEEDSDGFFKADDGTNLSLKLVDGEPIIISQEYPVISGILVIAEGGGNLQVKFDILSSIQTLLDVPNDNITILSGNK